MSTPAHPPSASPSPPGSIVSPCPHRPHCPPPTCLPFATAPTDSPTTAPPASTPTTTSTPADRPSTPPGPTTPPAEPGDGSGYLAATGAIRLFGGTLHDSGVGVDRLGQQAPRFEGWHLIPMAGIPIIGLPFVSRFNAISDGWSDGARILKDVLVADSAKVVKAADNYTAAEKAARESIEKTHR